MSWRVWKWTFDPRFTRQQWLMPADSQVVHVAEDPGLPFPTVAIWTQHLDATQKFIEPRAFELVGTGHQTEHPPGAHVGTAVLRNGLVLHVFEVDYRAELDEHEREAQNSEEEKS